MRRTIYIEQGIVVRDQDLSGARKLFGLEEKTRFYMANYSDKSYYPSTSAEYLDGRPFEITI